MSPNESQRAQHLGKSDVKKNFQKNSLATLAAKLTIQLSVSHTTLYISDGTNLGFGSSLFGFERKAQGLGSVRLYV